MHRPIRPDIEAALAALPVLPERRHQIPAEAVWIVERWLAAQRAEDDQLAWRGKDARKAAKALVPSLGQALDSLEHAARRELDWGAVAALLESAERTVAKHEPKAGPPKKIVAAQVAEAAAASYARLTGQRATVTTDPRSNEARGAYLALTTELFAVLAIDASPETWARARRARRAS